MILAIDTSSAIGVAAIDETGQTLVTESIDAPRGHAELLSPMVTRVVDACGRPTEIVVGSGPAPFTGLRVGLVTAQTLAFAWDIPVAGMCSLDALGFVYRDATVVTDARRREVYWARYADGVRIDGPAVSHPVDVPAAEVFVGAGTSLYPESLSGHPAVVDAADLARAYLRDVSLGVTDFPTEPRYLRRPDVHGPPA